MTTQIKAGVIAANAVNSSELASGALSGQNFTGDVTFDTTTLKIDSSNNRVGIGTASPSVDLETLGSGGIKTGNASGTGLFKADGGSTKIGSFSNHRFDLITNNTVRASIDTSGNLGIGTTSPTSNLTVNGTTGLTITGMAGVTNPAIYIPQGGILGDNAGTFEIRNGGGTSSELRLSSRSFHTFYTGGGGDLGTGTEKMRIDSSGNVGIGTNSPSRLLHVNGQAQFENNIVLNENTPALVVPNGDFRIFTGGSETLRISSGRNLKFVAQTTNFESPGFTYHTNNYLYLRGGSSGLILSDDSGSNTIQIIDGSSGYINFETSNGSSKMRIDATGRVGIGTTSPETFLHIKTTSPTISMTDTNSFSDTNDRFQLRANADVGMFQWYDDSSSSTSTLMTITQAGDVLIGQTSQTGYAFAEKLVVGDGNANDGITIQSGSTHQGNLAFNHSDGTTAHGRISYQHNSNYMSFFTNNTERMRINSNGTLMVGTTTNATYVHKAHFSGNANIDGIVRIEDIDSSISLGNACLGLAFPNDSDATNGYFIYMTDGNGAIGSIQAASGTSVSFNTTSDERLKKNIVNASPQLDIIKSVKVREFDWKRNDHHELGLIAQEIKDIIPNVVSGGGDDETKDPYGVDYGKLTPYLIKAIQEQQTIIDDLKSRIETLEG